MDKRDMSADRGIALNQVPLLDAAELLDRWWHDITPPGAVASRLTPDSVMDRARRAGCEVDIGPIDSWERRTDEDLLDEVYRRAGPFSGDLLLITEASFQLGGGAFRVAASALSGMMKMHQERFEPVFNGDVILLVLDERRIVCVHHENHLVKITPPLA